MIARAGAAQALFDAARLNREDPILKGSTLVFPNYGQLVMTGDLHGHRRNFERLKRFCNLENFGARHVILHELIHEEISGLAGRDTSYELLVEAAKWKCEFPDQIHFLLSNHELAQLTRHEISKNGRIVTVAFEESVRDAYGRDAVEVLAGLDEMVRSYPLAGRTPNRVFLSHSLPGLRELPTFDATVLARTPDDQDLHDGGSAHSLVWGRYQSAAVLQTLGEILDADFFICGHQPQESGFEILHNRMVILASDHNHGTFLTLDLSKPITIDSLARNIRPFASIE